MAIIQLSLWKNKVCRRCGVEKPPTAFCKSTQNKDGLYSYCRECGRVAALEWKHRNAELHRERARVYYKENLEKARNASRLCRKKKPEFYKARDAAYQKKNRDKYAQYTRIRSHRMRGNGGSYTQEEWQQLCERFDHRCLCCGAKVNLTVDHVIPVAKGGTNNIDNIQPLCRPCNSRKGDRTIDYRNRQAPN